MIGDWWLVAGGHWSCVLVIDRWPLKLFAVFVVGHGSLFFCIGCGSWVFCCPSLVGPLVLYHYHDTTPSSLLTLNLGIYLVVENILSL